MNRECQSYLELRTRTMRKVNSTISEFQQQKTDKNTHAQQRDKTRTFNYRKPKITNLKPQPHAKMLNNRAGVLKTKAISSTKTQLKTKAKSETDEDTKMKKKEWKSSINEQVRSC